MLRGQPLRGKAGTLQTLLPRYERRLQIWAQCLPWHVAIAQIAWERHRDVLTMKALGLRYKAIAERTGLSRTAIKVLVFRTSMQKDGVLDISPVQRWLSHSGDLAEMGEKLREQQEGRSYYGRRNIGAHRRESFSMTDRHSSQIKSDLQ